MVAGVAAMAVYSSSCVTEYRAVVRWPDPFWEGQLS